MTYNLIMKIIERITYMNQLKSVKNTPDIKVITGIRRSGKSKLMDMFSESLEQEEKANVVRVKFNLKKFQNLQNANNLYDYVEKSYIKGKTNYLLIDEVQMCNGFEEVISSIHEEELFDIYLTGSNAFLLSSDLATLFGGRVFEISMFPFSFSEYLKYYPTKDIDTAFDDYFVRGGMSGSYAYRTNKDATKYVGEVFKTTIVRDIVQKYRIENEDLLLMLANFMMDSIGSQLSIRNIASKLTSSTYTTNDKTVGSYLNYLCKSFLFYPIARYDIKGKKYLESDKKYYLADLSFRYSELGTRYADYGHLYENMVAIELLRRGYEVYVGQLYKKEIDFVVRKKGMIQYIQVSDDISSKETFQREISPLLAIRDAYPKMIIARTKHPEMQQEGIRIIDIARWLSNTAEENGSQV